jgi:hypothetical protein
VLDDDELPPLAFELRELILVEQSAPLFRAEARARLRDQLSLAIGPNPRHVARLPRWSSRSLPGLAVGLACGLVLAMYCTNSDMGGDPTSPRGDGHYRPVLARGDGHMLYLMARSTALDGDWIFDNDLARFGDPWNEPRTKTGRKSIVHPIGPALVWTPLIWIAEGAAVVANIFGADIPLHGYTLWHQRFVFLSSVVFACGAVLLGRKLANKAIGGMWCSAYAAIAVLLGTSLTYYATYMPSYGHAMDAFACAAFLAYWAQTVGRCDRRRWCVLGLLLGIAALIRVQEVAMGVVVAIEIVAQITAGRTRSQQPSMQLARWVTGGALVLAVALVAFIPQLIEWHLVFGSVTSLPQGPRFTRFEAPMIGELLFSARNGWFSTTPIVYAGVIGLLCLPKRSRLIAVGLFAAVALQVYLNSTVLDWWASASFGQRRLCSVTLPLVVGLAALLWRFGNLARRARVPCAIAHGLAGIGLGAFVAWNLRSVTKLSGGKSAATELVPTCCSNVPRPARRVARWLYDRIGSPFEFPANAVFSIEHGVPLSRWDITVGNYPLMPSLADVRDDQQLKQLRGSWAVGSASLTPYLVGDWSEPSHAERWYRATMSRDAVVLVPNLLPDAQRITIWLAAGVARQARIEWNGETVRSVDLDERWTPVQFDLEQPSLHVNELKIVSSFVPMWSPVEHGRGLIRVSDLEVRLR